MFKKGDRVVCINTSGIFSLKMYEVYIVIKYDDGLLYIIDDKYGHINWYSSNRFILYTLKDERKDKLNKLCSKQVTE